MPNVAMAPFVPPLGVELCETFLFGVYSALFAFSTFLMLRKGLSNRTTNAMLVVSVVMYGAAATHWALEIALTIRQSTHSKVHVMPTPSESVALIYVPAINFFLSDSIVLWRAWVLWNRRSMWFIPPLIFLFSTLVFSVAGLVLAYEGFTTHSAYKANMSYILKWILWGFTISTNLWATCLIFIRAWQHRRSLHSQFSNKSATSKTESALAFLVESGALYLCLWLTFVILAALKSPAVLLFRTNIVQLVGIYPTAIFTVVTMQMSAADILTRPGPQTLHHPPVVGFVPLPPTAQLSTLTTMVGNSSDSDSFIGSCEDRLTRTLASSDPEK
ncbi:hypothetical protein BJV78DRAFT_1352427 [Lactifluus subvellereus]|nr:hypothetical protein BJV78DRAFT_1352427 [Lactifluus subvellereus]